MVDTTDEIDDDTSIRPLLVASVVFTSLVGTLLGYDIGIISGAILYIEKELDLDPTQAEIIVGSLNLVSAFGGLGSGQVADRWGRKVAGQRTSPLELIAASVNRTAISSISRHW